MTLSQREEARRGLTIYAGGRYRTRSGSTARVYQIARYGQESVAIGALFHGDEFISAEHWHLDGTYDRARSTGMDITGALT